MIKSLLYKLWNPLLFSIVVVWCSFIGGPTSAYSILLPPLSPPFHAYQGQLQHQLQQRKASNFPRFLRLILLEDSYAAFHEQSRKEFVDSLRIWLDHDAVKKRKDLAEDRETLLKAIDVEPEKIDNAKIGPSYINIFTKMYSADHELTKQAKSYFQLESKLDHKQMGKMAQAYGNFADVYKKQLDLDPKFGPVAESLTNVLKFNRQAAEKLEKNENVAQENKEIAKSYSNYLQRYQSAISKKEDGGADVVKKLGGALGKVISVVSPAPPPCPPSEEEGPKVGQKKKGKDAHILDDDDDDDDDDHNVTPPTLSSADSHLSPSTRPSLHKTSSTVDSSSRVGSTATHEDSSTVESPSSHKNPATPPRAVASLDVPVELDALIEMMGDSVVLEKYSEIERNKKLLLDYQQAMDEIQKEVHHSSTNIQKKVNEFKSKGLTIDQYIQNSELRILQNIHRDKMGRLSSIQLDITNTKSRLEKIFEAKEKFKTKFLLTPINETEIKSSVEREKRKKLQLQTLNVLNKVAGEKTKGHEPLTAADLVLFTQALQECGWKMAGPSESIDATSFISFLREKLPNTHAITAKMHPSAPPPPPTPTPSKLIGRGASGCVFEPAVACPGVPVIHGTVSKIFRNLPNPANTKYRSSADREQDEHHILEQLDPNGDFSVRLVAKCTIPRIQVPPEYFTEACKRRSSEGGSADMGQNLQEYQQIIYTKGGVTLAKLKPEEIPLHKVGCSLEGLFHGLYELDKNDFVHGDLTHLNNLMFNPETKKAVFIDFGNAKKVAKTDSNYKFEKEYQIGTFAARIMDFIERYSIRYSDNRIKPSLQDQAIQKELLQLLQDMIKEAPERPTNPQEAYQRYKDIVKRMCFASGTASLRVLM